MLIMLSKKSFGHIFQLFIKFVNFIMHNSPSRPKKYIEYFNQKIIVEIQENSFSHIEQTTVPSLEVCVNRLEIIRFEMVG